MDNAPLTNKFISIPKDMGKVNCASFIGGILRGMLDGGGFVRCLAPPISARARVPTSTSTSTHACACSLLVSQPATVITHLDATPAFPDATIFAIKFETGGADGDA